MCNIYIYIAYINTCPYIYIYIMDYIIKMHMTVKDCILNYRAIHSSGRETSAEECFL